MRIFETKTIVGKEIEIMGTLLPSWIVVTNATLNERDRIWLIWDSRQIQASIRKIYRQYTEVLAWNNQHLLKLLLCMKPMIINRRYHYRS